MVVEEVLLVVCKYEQYCARKSTLFLVFLKKLWTVPTAVSKINTGKWGGEIPTLLHYMPQQFLDYTAVKDNNKSDGVKNECFSGFLVINKHQSIVCH